MADDRLRELERRFKESGAPDDAVAFLVARVRAGQRLDGDDYERLAALNAAVAADYLRAREERGDLHESELLVAAGLGEPGALNLLEGTAPEDRRRAYLDALSAEVERDLPQRVRTRLLLPLARAAVGGLGHEDEPLNAGLDAAEAYLLCGQEDAKPFWQVVEGDYGDLYCDPGCCWGPQTLAAYLVALALTESAGAEAVRRAHQNDAFHEATNFDYLFEETPMTLEPAQLNAILSETLRGKRSSESDDR